MTREGKRAMMLYIDEEVYRQIKALANAKRPPVKPGPMAAEILRQFLIGGKNGKKSLSR